jgi:hypothetical protein
MMIDRGKRTKYLNTLQKPSFDFIDESLRHLDCLLLLDRHF